MILECISCVFPEGYVLRYLDLPKDGNVVVLSEVNLKTHADGLDGECVVLESSIQAYVRQEGLRGIYSRVMEDLKTFYSCLKGSEGKELGCYYIQRVYDMNLLYVGKDKDDNFLFSLTFKIKYNEKEGVKADG